MNVRLFHGTLYLWNLTTNFDETWHEVHPYTESESWKISFDITHKQKFYINYNILYKRLYLCVSRNAISLKPDHQF